MPDKKPTDAEIIRALNTALGVEHISIYCVNIKNEVQTVRVLDIIDLINRLQAKNERLTIRLRKAEHQLDDAMKMYNTIKAEAYKQCIEKVKDLFDEDDVCSRRWLDNLLKELVGEDNFEQVDK